MAKTNYAELIRDSMNKMAALLDRTKAENRDLTDEEQAAFLGYEAEVTRYKAASEREQKIQDIRDDLSTPVTQTPRVDVSVGFGPARPTGFSSFLTDVVRAVRGEPVRDIKNLGTGMQQAVGSDGGFGVQQQFVNELNQVVFTQAKLLPRVYQRPVPDGFSGVKIPALAETSRADSSRSGGAVAAWVTEGGTGSYSKPKLREIDLKLAKLLAFCAMTEELLQDSVGLEQFVKEVYGSEIAYQADDAILNGPGNGTPLGIMNSPALVEVAKESGQTADTIVWQNIVKMYSRLKVKNPKSVAWLVTAEAFPQLSTMARVIGTAGTPVWETEGRDGVGAPSKTLLGYPLIICEQAAKLGDKGDIVLADLSDYRWIDKNGIQGDTSIHVHFLTDESLFRFRYRCNGTPYTNAPLVSAKNPSFATSPYVTLAARA